MKRFLAFAAGMLVLAAALALVVAHANRDGRGGRAPGERLRVVATTTIVADLVRELAGDRVALDALMGPGVDPHLYVASERDVDRLMAADVIVFSGLHLEGKLTDLLEELGARGRPTIAVADGLPEERLRHADGFSGAHDPHVWFDVALWREGARHVAERLAALDPADAPAYRADGQRYVAELERLDAWVRGEVGRIPPTARILVTAHDAFGYFGAAYGIEVAAVQGISTSAEAGSADLQHLADLVAARRVPAIFLESSVPPRIVEALEAAVRSRGFEVRLGGSLYSDALGEAAGPAGTYVGMVRHNVTTIVGALAADAEGPLGPARAPARTGAAVARDTLDRGGSDGGER